MIGMVAFDTAQRPDDKKVIVGQWVLRRMGPETVRATCVDKEIARTGDADNECCASTPQDLILQMSTR